MTLYILPIVEGQTEQFAIERLLHRLWRELLGQIERLQIIKPFRCHRDELAHPNGVMLTEFVQAAYQTLSAKAQRDAEARLMLLILLDAEHACPATLAPNLLKTAKATLPPEAVVSCVLAKRMTENWIVAGCSSLAGVNDLPNPFQPPPEPEACNGADWLDDQLKSVNKNGKYRKTVDAQEFIARMNLHRCRAAAPSFDKLCRDLEAQALPSSGSE